LKGDFLYNFLFPTRLAGGFLFRFAQLPKGINRDPLHAADFSFEKADLFSYRLL